MVYFIWRYHHQWLEVLYNTASSLGIVPHARVVGKIIWNYIDVIMTTMASQITNLTVV